MSPRQVIQSFQVFQDDMIKDRLMAAAIKAFKSHEVDIRDFSISELAIMIELVGKHSPKDLYQFYKFVE